LHEIVLTDDVMQSNLEPKIESNWPLAAGRWPLAAGRWPLAAGAWLVA